MPVETPLIIEQHIHGAYGTDFNTACADEIAGLCKNLIKHGIGGIFPTLVTDSVENLKRQISVIKKASRQYSAILGIHLEGVFINSEKKGIHNPEHFLALTPENYRLIEDDFVKIVTLAPELDKGLIDYLLSKGVKVQAGHCTGGDLSKTGGVTHIFNAMSGITHRGESTALSALLDDRIYTEVIADGIHVSDNALKLLFKSKPDDKIILVSDSLPITYSNIKQTVFAGFEIFYDGYKAVSNSGTIAGSTILPDGIIKRLGKSGMFKPQYIENVYRYHGIEPYGKIVWDDDWNIIQVS